MSPVKWYHKKAFCIPIWSILFAILVSAAAYAQRQTLELTTYYPLPYGEYTELKVKNKLEVFNRLEALINPKAAPVSQSGLVIDLSDTKNQFRVSALYDLNDQNYGIDLTGTSVLRHFGVDNWVKFGGMDALKSWPVIMKSGDYPTITPAVPSSGNTSMKIYYGTSQSTKVRLPQNFTNNSYFVLISPRELRKDGSLPGHKHTVTANILGTWSSEFGNSPTFFTYYEISSITKTAKDFTVNFRNDGAGGAVPLVFDWIAIGY